MTKNEIRQILQNMSDGLTDLISRDPRIIEFFQKNDITDSETKNQIIAWLAYAGCGAYVSGDAKEDYVAKEILGLASSMTIDIEEELEDQFDNIGPVLEKLFQECSPIWLQALADIIENLDDEE